jgi:hypothetical protein
MSRSEVVLFAVCTAAWFVVLLVVANLPWVAFAMLVWTFAIANWGFTVGRRGRCGCD